MIKSLGDYIQDRTESLDERTIRQYFIEKDGDKKARLLDIEQYLVEGSRGVGKTMLMRSAEIEASDNFGKESVLAVWISFEESIRIERIKIITESNIDPFLQWTMGKILIEILKKILELRPTYTKEINTKLADIFKVNNTNPNKTYEEYMYLLSEYIEALEKADIDDNSKVIEIAPSEKVVQILDNPSGFKQFLIKLIEDFKLKRMVLLFDEAAHVFSDSQQVKFFTFFKALRDPKIACKAAVYPGITNYGKYFEKNQDAKELKLLWSMFEDNDIKYIKKIVRKRMQEYSVESWNLLSLNNEIIDMICYSSNGNPRFAFHIIDEMQNEGLLSRKSITVSQLVNCLRSVNNEKWKDFTTLRQRMIRYAEYITTSENLMKEMFLPNLRKWNEKRRHDGKKLSVGFYVEEYTYRQLEKMFDVLSYANIISLDDSKKSIGHGKYGFYVMINPSFLFSDLIIKDTKEMKMISNNIDNNQVYSESTEGLGEIINSLTEHQEFCCSNESCDFATDDESFTYCKKCGAPMKKREDISLYKILRSHSIENLNLSTKIILRLKEKFDTIGEVYDADLDDIRMKYIQDIRIERIKNAAIEYMAG